MSSKKRKKGEDLKLPDHWIVVPSKSYANKTYYFNTKTRQSTWTKPCLSSEEKKKGAEKPPQTVPSNDNVENRKLLKANRSKISFKIDSQKEKEVKTVVKTKSKKPQCDVGVPSKKQESTSVKSSSKAGKPPSKPLSTDYLRDVNNVKPSTSSQSVSSGNLKNDQEIPFNEKFVLSTKGVKKQSAQERLIKKRLQYEAMARKFFKDSGESIKHSNKNDGRKESKAEPSCLSRIKNSIQTKAKDIVRNRIKNDQKFQENIKDLHNYNVDKIYIDHNVSASSIEDEEMDWEESQQEIMIEHINSIRRNLNQATELSADIAICSNKMNWDTTDCSKLVVVFDTNVFISCLGFIKDIVNKDIPDFGLPNIFIPWRVLQELDNLKTSKDMQLSAGAMKAIRFINKNFTEGHPRISGQSFEDSISLKNDQTLSPDDEILKMCLDLIKLGDSNTVVLITNDKNLESKAIVSNVQAYSKDRFVEKMLSCSNKKSDNIVSMSKVPQNQHLYQRFKDILKNSLGQLVEIELMEAFGNDWKTVVVRKPPWTLLDIMECLIKHWVAVFSFLFQRIVLVHIKDLNQSLRKIDKGSESLIPESIEVGKELFTAMVDVVHFNKPYRNSLEQGILDLKALLVPGEVPSENLPSTSEMYCETSLAPVSMSYNQVQNADDNDFTALLDPQQCREKVKNVFQIIWDQVKNICLRISELTAGNGAACPDVVNEIKTQFPASLGKLQELIEIVDKILSTAPENIANGDQLILHFSSFLVNLNIFQIDDNELVKLPVLIRFFCCDNDGRAILSSLVNDLKQFGLEMMNGVKLLGIM